MSAENAKSQARQRLTEIGGDRELDLTEQAAVQGLVHNLARAVFTALELGFTPNEIRAAYHEGASVQHKPPIDPSLDPEYWLRVHEEAEQFWLRRLQGEE